MTITSLNNLKVVDVGQRVKRGTQQYMELS